MTVPARSTWLGYGVAVAPTAAMMLLRAAPAVMLAEDASLILFLISAMAAAWLGGWKPGLLATALGVVAVRTGVGEHPAGRVLDADDAVGEQGDGLGEREKVVGPGALARVEHARGERLQAFPAHVRRHGDGSSHESLPLGLLAQATKLICRDMLICGGIGLPTPPAGKQRSQCLLEP